MTVFSKTTFLTMWDRYFPSAEIPLFWYYSDMVVGERVQSPVGHRCMICSLATVRHGETVSFGTESFGCQGGRRYCGYAEQSADSMASFLSMGEPGKIEGLRRKMTPELVILQRSMILHRRAPRPYLVFGRLDRLGEEEVPQAIVCFATPDILSGLVGLAEFDTADPDTVVTTSGAGCATIVQYPYQQLFSSAPKAIVGMFDISARPCLPEDRLSFAVPWTRFVTMVSLMEESFLITPAWEVIRKRIGRSH